MSGLLRRTLPASLFTSGCRRDGGERVVGVARGAAAIPPLPLRRRPDGTDRVDGSWSRRLRATDRGHSTVRSSGQRPVQRT